MAFEFNPVRPSGLQVTGSHPLQRLASLRLSLPKAPGAVAAYVPWAITGNILITSGQLPWIEGQLLYKGKIGRDLTPEQGYDAYQLATLNAMAQLADALGDLSRVRRVVRLEGTSTWRPDLQAIRQS